MKFKRTSRSGGLVVELGPKEKAIPSETQPKLFRLKKILVPMDFSECSQKALQYGTALAKQFGAELTVLHVVHSFVQVPDLAVVDIESLQNQMRDSAQKQLTELQSTIDPKITSHTLVRFGEPSAEIVSAALEADLDLIVVSTHGHTGLKHVFLGSVAERVVRHAKCPVLVVREREHEFITE